MKKIPNPDLVFPNAYGTTCFLKNVITAPNVSVGDYPYYDDPEDPTGFERNNLLYNWPEFGEKLIIGKFCCIGSGARFVMGPANHRMSSVTTYPFAVFGGAWEEAAPPHLSQLPRKGDTVVGNDVWLGRDCVIMPGVRIGDGAIVGAQAVVTRDVKPYEIVGGNPARPLRMRFDEEMRELLLKLRWWDREGEELVQLIPLLCDPNLEHVRRELRVLCGE